MKADIGIYHGDEAWALKGLGIDFEKAFQELGFTTVRTDQVFNGIRPLNARNHFFVQQGQLLIFCSNLNLIPKNTICLFTHYSSDFGEQLKVLNRSKGVIFFSQYQEALALSNGLKDDISTSIIMAADPKKHRILKDDELNKKLIQSFELNPKREYVGFCLKYWEKNTYQSRKSYSKIIEVIGKLVKVGIPCMILGPGWKKAKDLSDKVKLIETEYKNYEHFYNIMSIFTSISINEGGPLPLLESMMCGATPVATTTGFSNELMLDLYPQNLLPCMTESNDIARKIISCYHRTANPSLVSQHAQAFSFLNAAQLISSKFFQ